VQADTLSANPLTTLSLARVSLELREHEPSGFLLIAEATTTIPGMPMLPANRLRGTLSARPFRTLCHKPHNFSEDIECYKETECIHDEHMASQAPAISMEVGESRLA
jgi:hypothetical protein